jgi:hypothetical protein
MSDAAATVAQQGYSAQSERIRTGLLLAHYLLRISFPNLLLSLFFLLFIIPFGSIFILSIYGTLEMVSEMLVSYFL